MTVAGLEVVLEPCLAEREAEGWVVATAVATVAARTAAVATVVAGTVKAAVTGPGHSVRPHPLYERSYVPRLFFQTSYLG